MDRRNHPVKEKKYEKQRNQLTESQPHGKPEELQPEQPQVPHLVVLFLDLEQRSVL